MILEFNIPGDVPSKKNSKRWIMRGSKKFLVPSAAHKNWHDEQSWNIQRYRPPEPIKKTSSILISFFPKTHRKFDLTNKAESIMDLLVDCKFLEDDNITVCPHITLMMGGVDKDNPRSLITIRYGYEPNNPPA